MKNSIKYLLIFVVISCIIPQIAFASWWNPFTWNIFNLPSSSTQKTTQAVAPAPTPQPAASIKTSTNNSPQVQTGLSGCIANQILPDSRCTPGAVLTTDAKIVCVVGYTKTVRDVSDTTKKKVFAEYGIDYSLHGNYEVDHLISLELGGSNYISNLWPENSTITSGSLTKDKFENYLHMQVCNGNMTLTEAQKEISTNWVQYYSAVLNATPTTTAPTQANMVVPVVPIITPTQNTSPATQTDNSVPVGATGACNDGTYTYAVHHQGACSHHGGVEEWY